MLKVKQFIAFLYLVLGKFTKYMWGDYGRVITEKTIEAKAKQYPKHYDEAYQAELRGVIGKAIGCDCTGLIKWFLWTGGDATKEPNYSSATDNSASGWYRIAKVRGDINTLPKDRVGLILSMPGHCGVYVGNGEVIECTKSKFGNGVVKTKLSDRKWEKWCECAFIDYTPEVSEKNIKTTNAKVTQCRPVYSTANFTQKIGTVFDKDKVQLIGMIGRAAAIIYPTPQTLKIGFVENDFIEEED